MPNAELSDRELRLLRLRSQGLLPETRSGSLAKTAARAFCLQAQDVAAATLAVRARTEGPTAARIARQGRDKAVCRAWLMRNTIHLFATRDLAWMRPLLAGRPRALGTSRLQQLGVGERKLRRVLDALADRIQAGPLPRREATELIRSHGIESGADGNAVYWVIHIAALDGISVVRPALDTKQVLVPGPEPEDLERTDGLGRLARRYLRAYAPADPHDFAYWAKMPVADARRGFERAGRLASVETSRGTLFAFPGALEFPAVEGPSVRLLGLWDNFLLGHRDRELIVPRGAAGWVQPGGALLKQTAFADGLAFGSWRLERHRGKLTVAVEPFDRIPRGVKPGLEAEVADLARYFEAEAKLELRR